MNIDWEEQPSESAETSAPEESNPLQELYALEDAKAKIDARIKYLKDALSVTIPEEKFIGHWSSGEYVAIAMRDEVWKWNEVALMEIISKEFTGGLPEFVKQRLSISKSEFKKLPAGLQEKLLDALEKRPSAVKIIVRKREDMERITNDV